MKKNFFKDLIILDHTRYLLGGYATQVFADLGATVIKIEDTKTGDFCRAEDPMRGGVSHYFSALNRNKQSICLNFKSDKGREAYFRLLKTADIVIENFRPGVMDRLGIGRDVEVSVNPRIIHCSMSSFGKDDPRSLKALHDINFQALSGYLSLNGAKISPIHFVDVSTGMAAVQNLMAALLQREVTGEGSYCDVKMFDSFVWWNALIDARYDFQGESVSSETLDFPALAYNIYETNDGGHISIAMLEEKFWQSFLKALGREDLIPYKRMRRQEAPEAFASLEAEFKKRSYAEWEDFLADKDICAMPVISKDAAVKQIVNSGTGLMQYLDFPKTGKTLQTRIPIAVDSLPVSLDGASPAPELGEHTRKVLLAAGYSDQEIDLMAAEGSILA